MPFNLLLLPLLGGFVFIRQFRLTRFSTSRLSGQRLIIWAALTGVVFTIIARCIVVVTLEYYPAVGVFWHNLVPFNYSGTSFIAFTFGVVSWIPLNFFTPKEEAIQWTINRYGSEAEKLFSRSFEEDKQLQLTLSDGKVYVGYMFWNPPEPHHDCSYVSVLPTISGYRTAETKEVRYTTDYTGIYTLICGGDEAANEELDIEDFLKCFPLDNIITVSIFDPDVRSFFDKKE